MNAVDYLPPLSNQYILLLAQNWKVLTYTNTSSYLNLVWTHLHNTLLSIFHSELNAIVAGSSIDKWDGKTLAEIHVPLECLLS